MTSVNNQPVKFLNIYFKPVRLHSGGFSQFLVNAHGLYEDERMRMAVITYWKRYLDTHWRHNRFHFIAIPTGGVMWGEELFRVMSMDTDEHRFNLSTDDFDVKPNCSTILVDDVLTTGGSLIEVASHLSRDAFPTKALTVVDRRWERGPTPQGALWVADRQLFLSVKHWARIPLPTEVS